MRCGRIERSQWERRVSYTDLAVEGARVNDVFLGLVGIHWVRSVGFRGRRKREMLTSKSLGNLCYSVMVRRTGDLID